MFPPCWLPRRRTGAHIRGWVAQLAGALDPRLVFAVSLAGPTVRVREQDLKNVELDSMITPEQNRTRFDEIFPTGAPTNTAWHEVAKSNHMFRLTDTVCFDWEASLANLYSEEFQSFLAEWVDTLFPRTN